MRRKQRSVRDCLETVRSSRHKALSRKQRHVLVTPTTGVRDIKRNLQKCVLSWRRRSPNWRQSVYDSGTRRVIVPRAEEKQRDCVLSLQQVPSIWMRTESRAGLWNACELWKLK